MKSTTQDLAVLRKIYTNETAPYDDTIATLKRMPPDETVSNELATRILELAMAADRSVVEKFKASVGATRDQDVKFRGATAGYLLRIANVLYE